ncbi:unnamed protein product [Caenorhabditis angaria]|uniref:Major sperm protein n=1 Tax=Caenorhabditis angaria TaxID=860376 RepID=A0A9P1MVJ7_9PELO|nr:unnamed protein product [Caenorhabditis angaria]
MITQIIILVFTIQFSHGILNKISDVQPGYGYIGPACAVFDGTLYLHGVSMRHLSIQEQRVFRAYQNDLSVFNDATYDSFETNVPTVPKFCGGYDDSIEIVLDSCLVRNNHVYVGDMLIRSLTNFERQKIQLVKMRRMYGESRKRRSRRSSNPINKPHRDFSDMLHKLLNINATVTQRFLPVVSKSPMFAMEGPWQNLLELSVKQPGGLTNLLKTGIETTQPESKIETPYRATFTTTMRPISFFKSIPEKPIKMYKTTPATITEAPITTSTVRQISINPIRPVQVRPDPPNVKTVVDPLIIQLIKKALSKNQLIDENALKKIMSKPISTTTTVPPLRFTIPPSFPTSSQVAGFSHNHLFIPHQPYTTLSSTDPKYIEPSKLSHRLPNEIFQYGSISSTRRYPNSTKCKDCVQCPVINSSARRIGYGIKTTNMKRLGVDPPCGVLDPKEAVLLAVSCDAFAYGQEDTNNDRITVEWTNTPDGAAKQFRREWFQGDGMVRRKNLPIEYNP